MPGDALRRGTAALENSWGVIGAHEAVSRSNDRSGDGERPYSTATFAVMFDEAVRRFLLYTAVARYTDQLRGTFSAARDTARARHSRFKPRQIDQLRREVLSTSLDLPVVARDSAVLWQPSWRRWNGIEVRAAPPLGLSDPPEEFDLIDRFGEANSRAFAELVEEDAAYRDVLSTASSLGASAREARLGRLALLVAGASLAVALITLAATGDPSYLDQLLDWMRRK